MAEDRQKMRTIEEEEIKTDPESSDIKAELTDLKSVVHEVAKSRLLDKWALENRLEDTMDELEKEQKRHIVALQDSFEKELRAVRTECANKCKVMEEYIDGLHRKMDQLVDMMTQLSSDKNAMSTSSTSTLANQEKHQLADLHLNHLPCSKLPTSKSTTPRENKEKKGAERLMKGIRRNRNAAKMNNRNGAIRLDDEDAEGGIDGEVTASSGSEESQYDQRSPQPNSAQNDSPCRCRGPSPPPMETFHGERSKWNTFIFKFEQLAELWGWSPLEKLQRLIVCIKDRAVEYLETRPLFVLRDYRLLVADLNKRFKQKTPARVCRHQLEFIQQGKEEDMHDFSDRVYKLAVEGYPGENTQSIQSIAVDAFFCGCNNKLAAMTVMGRKPQTLSQAVCCLQSAIDDQKFLGKVSLIQQEPPEEPCLSASLTHQVNSPDDLAQMITTAVKKALATKRAATHARSTPQATSLKNCFNCGKRGHFARQCPHRSNCQKPITDPWKATVCFRCGGTGHFTRACAG